MRGLCSGQSLLVSDLLRAARMSDGLELAHRWSIQVQAMSSVDKAIENGVCHRWVCDHLVPVLDR